MKLRVGDEVLVLSGKDKGKTGSVTKVLPGLNKVVVDGINILKRAQKPSAKYPKGGLMAEPHPIAVAKVGIVHPGKSGRSSRIGYEIDKKGNKQRVYRQAANKPIKGTSNAK